MTNTTHTIVVGMMQTPPYDRMFEQSRRVYSAKGISPTLHTQGGQFRDKGIGGAVKHVRHKSEFISNFAHGNSSYRFKVQEPVGSHTKNL